jgi:hypothetical protein
MQVALSGVDAPLLPVANHRRRSAEQGAGGLPAPLDVPCRDEPRTVPTGAAMLTVRPLMPGGWAHPSTAQASRMRSR